MELRKALGWSEDEWQIRKTHFNKKWAKVAKQESQARQPGVATAPRQPRALFEWNGLCLKPNPYREHDDLESTKDACNDRVGRLL